jgi:hypothetical protein
MILFIKNISQTVIKTCIIKEEKQLENSLKISDEKDKKN